MTTNGMELMATIALLIGLSQLSLGLLLLSYVNYRTWNWFFIEELLMFHLWRRHRISNLQHNHLWNCENPFKSSQDAHTSRCYLPHVGIGFLTRDAVTYGIVRTQSKVVKMPRVSQRYLPHVDIGTPTRGAVTYGIVKILSRAVKTSHTRNVTYSMSIEVPSFTTTCNFALWYDYQKILNVQHLPM